MAAYSRAALSRLRVILLPNHTLTRLYSRSILQASTFGLSRGELILKTSQFLCVPIKYSTKAAGGSSITDSLLGTSSNQKTAEQVEPQKEEQEKKKESKWFGKNAWKLGLGVLGVLLCINGAFFVYDWGQPKRDEEGNLVEDEYSKHSLVIQYILRAFNEGRNYKQMIQDPSSQKLLPDPLKEPYFQPPYTLVLELNGVLIHPEWKRDTGWRFKKRPGLDYLLQTCGSPLFEIVIYTSEAGFNAFPLINSLDPQGYVMYRLFRDATRYQDGHHIKDLYCLNRDLNRVIMIDHDKKSFQLNPRNGLALKKWAGEEDDRALYDLANLLKTLATQGVEDVRPVVDYYARYEDPLQQYRDNQAKLQEEEEKLAELRSEDKQKRMQSSSIPGVSRFFRRG